MRYVIVSILFVMFLLILASFCSFVYGGVRCILLGFSRYSMEEIVHSEEFLCATIGLSCMIFLCFFVKYFIMYYVSLNMERRSDPVFPEVERTIVVLQDPLPFTSIHIKEEEDPIEISTI